MDDNNPSTGPAVNAEPPIDNGVQVPSVPETSLPSPVMDVKRPETNLNDVSMSPEEPATSESQSTTGLSPLPNDALASPASEGSETPPNQAPIIQPKPVKKSSSMGKVILIILIAVILAAAAIYLYVRNKHTSASVVTSQPATNTSVATVKTAVSNLDSSVSKADSAQDTTATDLTNPTLGL